MKKTIIERISRRIVDILTEGAVGVDEIYQRYYSDIDRDDFYKVIAADPTYRQESPNKMGRYGKWLLSLYRKGNLKDEDFYKATQYLETFVRFNSKIEKKDIGAYATLSDLYQTVEPFLSNPDQAASNSDSERRAKSGSERFYEDGQYLVIIPKTKEASIYYGKGTQWCTAAEHSNNAFESYASGGNLFIIIKKDTQEKWQFHFESESWMDATDSPVDPWDMDLPDVLVAKFAAYNRWPTPREHVVFRDNSCKITLANGKWWSSDHHGAEDGFYRVDSTREQTIFFTIGAKISKGYWVSGFTSDPSDDADVDAVHDVDNKIELVNAMSKIFGLSIGAIETLHERLPDIFPDMGSMMREIAQDQIYQESDDDEGDDSSVRYWKFKGGATVEVEMEDVPYGDSLNIFIVNEEYEIIGGPYKRIVLPPSKDHCWVEEADGRWHKVFAYPDQVKYVNNEWWDDVSQCQDIRGCLILRKRGGCPVLLNPEGEDVNKGRYAQFIDGRGIDDCIVGVTSDGKYTLVDINGNNRLDRFYDQIGPGLDMRRGVYAHINGKPYTFVRPKPIAN